MRLLPEFCVQLEHTTYIIIFVFFYQLCVHFCSYLLLVSLACTFIYCWQDQSTNIQHRSVSSASSLHGTCSLHDTRTLLVHQMLSVKLILTVYVITSFRRRLCDPVVYYLFFVSWFVATAASSCCQLTCVVVSVQFDSEIYPLNTFCQTLGLPLMSIFGVENSFE